MWLHQICIHAWQNICMFTHVELVDTPAPPFLLGGMTAAFAFLSSLYSSKRGAKDSESETCSETKALSFTKARPAALPPHQREASAEPNPRQSPTAGSGGSRPICETGLRAGVRRRRSRRCSPHTGSRSRRSSPTPLLDHGGPAGWARVAEAGLHANQNDIRLETAVLPTAAGLALLLQDA